MSVSHHSSEFHSRFFTALLTSVLAARRAQTLSQAPHVRRVFPAHGELIKFFHEVSDEIIVPADSLGTSAIA